MKTTTQSGKSLAGFIIGLLLATMVIVGVLFFLNKNKTTFKQPDVQNTPSQPEILKPSNSASNIPSTGGEGMSASSASTENNNIPNALPSPENTPQATPAPSRTTIKPPVEHKNTGKPTPQNNKAGKHTPTDKNKATPQPTVHPEDILNSGSLEKAEQKAQQKAKKTTNTDSGNKVILQVGSYYDQASADAQRAKLAMLGVDARIRKASVNGKTMYRVQTATLSRSQAQQLSNKLKQNKIDSLMRTAP